MTTTPDVPLRLEFEVEVPGTPEQVWDAIATADGLTAWFLPTDLEEREGGAMCTHMGEEASPATVTGWDPPRRFAYVEPEWAALASQDPATVTPLASEFLVEARSGGTCVVRVVTSAFGTGADWEREFFADMERHWRPYFDHLRLYLTHFPGQRATVLEAAADVPGTGVDAFTSLRGRLGADEVGRRVELRDMVGHVERIADQQLLVRLAGDVPGFVGFATYDKGEGRAVAEVRCYLFSADAPRLVERERAAWKAWLERLAVPAA